MNKPAINMQEVFDTVVAHARKQKARAIDPKSHMCAYRTPDGKKCFIGVLIPDSKYNPRIENKGVFAEDIKALLPFSLNAKEHKFLGDLQQIHDSYVVEEWEEKFEEVADEWGLSYSA